MGLAVAKVSLWQAKPAGCQDLHQSAIFKALDHQATVTLVGRATPDGRRLRERSWRRGACSRVRDSNYYMLRKRAADDSVLALAQAWLCYYLASQ